MNADILREKFLSFFKSRKHKIVESDSLVPKDDPTVLFTPAGMNQFKKEFLGFKSGFSRAATSQRCLRTDDLDKVGKTTGHHTFFEMLGNFSFGDYFKKEAITWAWEFLTQELKIPQDRLWVSVYIDDDEAERIWKNLIKVPAKKIIKLGDKDNFWPAEAKTKGPNGPCGPCSEIFYDFGKDKGCGEPICDPTCSCGRFVEIWNLVFTQFNRKADGTLEPLPNKNIDTGMGLERLAAVMQGAQNNFETDLFEPIIKEIVTRAQERKSTSQKELVYAIADHIRPIVFSIYDGVLPSNEARGYVVRKIIRKSLLHLRSLGIKKPFLHTLVPVVAQIMHSPYPELAQRQENIAQIILAEEESFIAALNSSVDLFKDKFREILKKPDAKKAGLVAFQLYDTYGIPLELAQDWARKNAIEISLESFNKELEQQKNRSKINSSMKGDVFASLGIDLGVKETKFSGYKEYSAKAKILKIIDESAEVKKVSKGSNAKLILDKTCFYAESGGQVGDTGQIVKGKNIFEVLDTEKVGKAILHIGKVKEGSFKKNDPVTTKLDLERRLSIARNHTATHLLQAALRKVLGGHVRQQGSLVAVDRLRFDFTHFKDISEDELRRIEGIVNGNILENYPLSVKEMGLQQAKKTGALAFFGEKYDSSVRVVAVSDFSKEFCGGTHLDSTGQIGIFKITQEGSVASGVRRIEAATGTFAYKKINEEEEVIHALKGALNVPLEGILQEIEKKNTRIKGLEKQLHAQRIDDIKDNLDKLIQDASLIKDVKVITKVFNDVNVDLLRKNVDLLKDKSPNSIILLAANNQGRAMLAMGITQDLCLKGIDASNIIREISGVIGGSGGGRKDFAQAGGSMPENFEQAFARLKEILGKLL